MSPQIENIRCDESTGPPFIKRCGLRLHESLNPPAGGPWASAAPRSVHSQWGKQKDVCSEPPGQGEPLINRHVLRAGGRPGNSLLCFITVSSAGRRGASTLRSALRVTEPGAVHRSPPSPGRPRGVRVFVSPDILQNLAPLHCYFWGLQGHVTCSP